MSDQLIMIGVIIGAVFVMLLGVLAMFSRFYRQVEQTQRLLVAAFERDADWQPSAAAKDESP